MASGGKRVGAGRKPGAENSKTRLIAEKAAAGGITPLEYMLQVLRADVPADADGETLASIRASKMDAAKAAAPYIHPRLTAVTVGGDEDRPLVVKHIELIPMTTDVESTDTTTT